MFWFRHVLTFLFVLNVCFVSHRCVYDFDPCRLVHTTQRRWIRITSGHSNKDRMYWSQQLFFFYIFFFPHPLLFFFVVFYYFFPLSSASHRLASWRCTMSGLKTSELSWAWRVLTGKTCIPLPYSLYFTRVTARSPFFLLSLWLFGRNLPRQISLERRPWPLAFTDGTSYDRSHPA